MRKNTAAHQSDDWLGLNRIASFLNGREASAGTGAASTPGEEVIDRLCRTLEVLALVEDHVKPLKEHARQAADHETIQLAVELRRLANRLQVIGDSLSSAGDRLFELENEILLELEERYRAQSARQDAA